MIKYIIALILTTSITYAACSIDEFETSCSVANIIKPQPMQQTYSPSSTIKEYSESPETRLKPSQDDRPQRQLRDFGPQKADYSYNTSCQFGVCNPSGAPILFRNRGQ